MLEWEVGLAVLLTAACLVCLIVLLRRSGATNAPGATIIVDAVRGVVRELKDDAVRARSEAADAAGKLREEVSRQLGLLNESTLDQSRALRQDVVQDIARTSDALVGLIRESATAQTERLAAFAGQLKDLSGAVSDRLKEGLERIEKDLAESKLELRDSLSGLKQETTTALESFRDSINKQMEAGASNLRQQLDSFGLQLNGFSEATDRRLADSSAMIEKRLDSLKESIEKRLAEIRDEGKSATLGMRTEVTDALKLYQESVKARLDEVAATMSRRLGEVGETLTRVTQGNEARMESLRGVVDQRLKELQDGNDKRLAEMRQTVEEKLEGTLERRLGESFKQVSDRLEQVHKGLGEMQSLATGVGDLKKVLTNVKTRGTWGEVQLGALLEQMFTRDQFDQNVITKKGSSERVEFAIRLPGRDAEGSPVWLPIDSKCPVEDYLRLVDASERGDQEAVRDCSRQLEMRIKDYAASIRDKYVAPPDSTDFAILFVPTEGLYAEILRIPGLAETTQRQHRVMIAGPTTLAALLCSLQMGFKTLAIEKRSSEVWNVLSAVKTEFGKFETVFSKVRKKLAQATDTIDEASTRTRAMERKLRTVHELPAIAASEVLGLVATEDGDAEEEQEPDVDEGE